MKRRIALSTAVLLAVSCLSILKPIAGQRLADGEKTRQELETMEGILKTTLDHALKRLERGDESEERQAAYGFGPFQTDGVRGFYLQGQGALFVIPVSALQRHPLVGMEVELVAIPSEEEINRITQEALDSAFGGLEAAQHSLESAEEELKHAEADLKKEQDKLRQRMAKQKARLQEVRESSRKRREERRQKHQELLKRLEEVKVYLKDMLAGYGDSLTVLKPEESVTLVLTGESSFSGWRSIDRGPCHVVSVRKSLVTDLKAGRMTRADFDRRVLDYSY